MESSFSEDELLLQLQQENDLHLNSTLNAFLAELDTVAADVRRPATPDPYAAEPELGEALSEAREIVRSPPSATTAEAPAPEAGVKAQPVMLGQYELLAELGSGGMGTVYKARHTRLDRLVALKVLPPGRVASQQSLARFEREMRAAGKLHHPHIVAAQDAGEIAGTHFLVMELVEGSDLAALVKHMGPLPIPEACEIVRQAATGLQHILQHGLVHRDIKPSNLMLARAADAEAPPIVKILDLGLALFQSGQESLAGELTSTGQVLGTIDYMAPEQGLDASQPVDIRADLYSLGATLFKLLTGRAPFEDPKYNTTMKRLRALDQDAPPSVRSLRPECPPELSTLIDRLLAKSPDARPATPAEVAKLLAPFAAGADLQRLLTDAPVAKPRTSDALSKTWMASSTVPLSVHPSPTAEIELYYTPHDVELGKNQLLFGGDKHLVLSLWKNEFKWNAPLGWNFERANKNSPLAVAYSMRPKIRQHLAGVVTKDKVQLYHDGKLVDEKPLPAEAGPVPEELFFGGFRWHNNWVPLNGVIDGIKISTTARYDGDFQRPETLSADQDTLALYDFAEGLRDELKDRSLHGHDGQIVGAKWVRTDHSSTRKFKRWALDFSEWANDRYSASVDVPEMSPSEPFTVELYATPRSVSDVRSILWHIHGNWLLNLNGTEPRNGGAIYLTAGRGTGEYDSISKFHHAQPGRRMHLAVTFDGQEMALYTDGQFAGSKPVTHTLPDTPLTGQFGGTERNDARGTTPFNGTMDAARISRGVRYDKNFTPPVELAKDDDTIVLYRFDEGSGDTVRDWSDNYHHGKIVGAKWVRRGGFDVTPSFATQDAPSPLPSSAGISALEFSGADNYVELPILPYVATAPLTVETWFTATSGDKGRPAAAEAKTDAVISAFHPDTQEAFYLLVDRPNAAWFILRQDAQVADTAWYHFERVDKRTDLYDTRHHAALVFDGKEVRLYVDGELKRSGGEHRKTNESDGPAVVWPQLKNYFLGAAVATRDGTSLTRFFQGTIDEVRISQKARYEQQFTPEERFSADADTMALYHFEERTGDVLKDASGHARDGKIVGAKWVTLRPPAIENPAATDYALDFNGSSSYVHVPKLVWDFKQPITLEAWVQVRDAKLPADIVGLSGALKVGAYRKLRAVAYEGPDELGWFDAAEIGDAWRHVAATFDGDHLKWFVDGRPADGRKYRWDGQSNWDLGELPAINPNVAFVDIPPGLWIGGQLRGKKLANALDGRIDEIRITRGVRYATEFTPSQRLAADAQTLALYHCNEGSGDILWDWSGNKLDGQIVGAKWVRLDGSADDPEVTLQKLPKGGYEVFAQNYRLRLAATGLIEKVEAGETKLIESTSFGGMGTSNRPVKATQTGATLTFEEGDDYRLAYEFGLRGFVVKVRVSAAAAERDGIDHKPYYLIHLTKFSTSAQRARPLDGLPPFDLPATKEEETYTNHFTVDFVEGAQVEVTSAKAEHSAFIFPGGAYTWGLTNLPGDEDQEIRFDIRAQGMDGKRAQPPLLVSEPPPLDEWLNGKTILTVAQDGSGQFKTIQAALDAVQAGQVVKVLDKGPYREHLKRSDIPSDAGLVTEVGTEIELPKWGEFVDSSGRRTLLGHDFMGGRGYRISGFVLTFPPRTSTDPAAPNVGMTLGFPHGGVLERCWIRGRSPFAEYLVDTWSDLGVCCFRECRFEGRLTLHAHRTVLVVRNEFTGPNSHLAIGPEQKRPRTIAIRNNVFHNLTHHVFATIFSKGELGQALEISNNSFLSPFAIFFEGPLSRSRVSICNNLSQGKGLALFKGEAEADLPHAVQDWDVRSNCSAAELAPDVDWKSSQIFPKSPTDVIGEPRWLSSNPTHHDFARIAADDPLVRRGVGGTWPNYLGALPPGPAPPEGDWYTRLQRCWGDAAPAEKQKSSAVDIQEPPPLGEWLKDKTTLTVAQDGSGQFTTIQAAIDALDPLKTGQVIRVLDRGPYRENLLFKNPPSVTALVSDVQTVIELVNWQPLAKTDELKDMLYGHQFIAVHRFRLSGFDFRYDHGPEPAKGYAVYFHHPAGVVVEDCRLVRKSGPLKGTGALGVIGWERGTTEPIVIQDCLFDSGGMALKPFSPKNDVGPSPPYLVRRNYLRGRSVRLVLSGNFSQALIEQNIQTGKLNDDCGLMISDLGPRTRLCIRHNTFHDVSYDHVRIPIAATSDIEYFRNILTAPIATVEKQGIRTPWDTSRWRVAGNAYAIAPESSGAHVVSTAGDLTVRPTFLSDNPEDSQYLRIAAEGPLAKLEPASDGTNYVGALLPGPAPSEGDWFTRLNKWSRIDSSP